MEEEYSPAVKLLADQMASRAVVREKFRANFPKLLDAHQFAFSALAAAVKRHLGKKIETPSAIVEGRIALIAQFLTGVEVCETAISEGLYSQAAALLKQELETVAAVEEYQQGRRRDGVTPKIGKGVTYGWGAVYGKLNEICHVSRHELAKDLVTEQVGELVGASIVPSFNAGLARFLYGQHVFYIVLVFRQADLLFKELYGEGVNGEEIAHAGMAQMILLKQGLIEVPADATGEEADWVRSLVALEVPMEKTSSA